MRTKPASVLISLLWVLCSALPASAVTNHFFHAGLIATLVSSNMSSATISSSGYYFTYSLDNWWSATPGGPPTGRFQSVLWPDGVDAQTITTGPTGPLTQQISASITFSRVDGQLFDFQSFTGQILGNTAGAGASFEIMPQLNGQDMLPNPLTFDATGYAGSSFTYSPALSGYDSYTLSLWMDFALTQLTVADASLPPALLISAAPTNQVRLSWPANASGYLLQQNVNLNPTNWSTVTNTISSAGPDNQVTLPTTGTQAVFRLILP